MAPNSSWVAPNGKQKDWDPCGGGRVGIARKNFNNVFDDFTAVGVHDNCAEPQAGGWWQFC